MLDVHQNIFPLCNVQQKLLSHSWWYSCVNVKNDDHSMNSSDETMDETKLRYVSKEPTFYIGKHTMQQDETGRSFLEL